MRLHGPSRYVPQLDPGTASVAVIMPVRNEAANIGEALRSIVGQTFPRDRLEVLVVDGCSADGTRQVVQSFPTDGLPLRLLDNPAGTIPAAMNVGIAATTADVVVRVDGHSVLAPDYVERCVGALATSGAANVGGLMRPDAGALGMTGRAMALALCSRFGIGDSRFHDLGLEQPEWAETAYLGAFRRDVLTEVGGYDERQLANEDFELNHRVREAGYGVLLSPQIRSRYVPRASVAAIARQFHRYGIWKARVMARHPRSVRPRHLAAPLLVITLALGGLGFALTRRPWTLLPAAMYTFCAVVASIREARPKSLIPALMLVFPAMHLSWGLGVIQGLLFANRDQSSRP